MRAPIDPSRILKGLLRHYKGSPWLSYLEDTNRDPGRVQSSMDPPWVQPLSMVSIVFCVKYC